MPESYDPTQADLVCLDCPLLERGGCDEESLWCAYRWATNPNAAQLAVATFRLIPQRLTRAETSAKWRQAHRERYNELQRERRARRKERDPIGYEAYLKRRREKAAQVSRRKAGTHDAHAGLAK